MREKKYTHIVTSYSNMLYRFIYKNYKDKAVAEDVVQEAFIKLWENRKKVDPKKVKSWLYSTAYRKLIDYIRSIKKYENLEEEHIQCTTSDISENDTIDLVTKYIDDLSVLYKSIIILRDIEGYNYKEISDILELTDAQVKVYLFRARKKLKELIEKQEIWISK